MKETSAVTKTTDIVTSCFLDKRTYRVQLRRHGHWGSYCDAWLTRRTEKSTRWHLMIYVGNSNMMINYDQDRRFTANTPEEAVHKMVETLQELGEAFTVAANSLKEASVTPE